MPCREACRNYYFNTDDFIDVVHELEEIPEIAPAQVVAPSDHVTEADVQRWHKLFGMNDDDSRYLIAQEVCKGLGFDELAYRFWLSCVGSNGVREPKDMVVVAVKAHGEFELFLKQSVDDVVMRLACAPEIERKNGMHTHDVFDDQRFMRDAIVLRQWESNRLKGKLPMTMRTGRYVLYTGCWECIPLAWAAKDLHDASRSPCIHESTLPQHRLNEALPVPLQDDYPVWYFLTGPVSKPKKLQTLLKRHFAPYKRCAIVHGLTTLRHRQFEATVESDFHEEYADLGPSVGAAYLIRSKEEEDRLRYFKTDHFVVVRCKITLCPIHESGQLHEVEGLTFVADPDSPLYESMRKIPVDQMAIPPTSSEPSIPFEGFELERLEGAEEGCEPLDRELTSYVFPFLRKGRECTAADVYQKRDLLRSPLRPRSPLTGMDRNSRPPSAPRSRERTPRSRVRVPSGSHLRSSEPR